MPLKQTYKLRQNGVWRIAYTECGQDLTEKDFFIELTRVMFFSLFEIHLVISRRNRNTVSMNHFVIPNVQLEKFCARKNRGKIAHEKINIRRRRREHYGFF